MHDAHKNTSTEKTTNRQPVYVAGEARQPAEVAAAPAQVTEDRLLTSGFALYNSARHVPAEITGSQYGTHVGEGAPADTLPLEPDAPGPPQPLVVEQVGEAPLQKPTAVPPHTGYFHH